MLDAGCGYCISSAVVLAKPELVGEIAATITRLGAEIAAIERSRIVVVMEGPNPGALAALLGEIANLHGVLAANMVFEHIEEERCPTS